MIFWVLTAAFAYETDPLTDRHIPLADVTEAASLVVNERLAQAVAETNARTRCDATPQRTLRILAREVHDRTGRAATIPSRGLVRGHGYTVYSTWLETDDGVDRRSFLDTRDDIFSDLDITESLILATAGTSSTFQLAGVVVGSDKPDHFWDLGYAYFRKSGWGEHPERGIAHGVATERGIYGLATSRAFSYADLSANYAGFQWYARLLTDQSELQLDADGCVVQVAPFDWSTWVTWDWDEALNPPLFTPVVERGVQRHLLANRDDYCASYHVWATAEDRARLEASLSARPTYATGAPTDRSDPYRLDALCTGSRG